MEQKNMSAKNNTNKKKKYKSVKRYALCFPFHIDIKIINEQKLFPVLLNQKLTQSNFSEKTKSLFFGLNTCLNHIQQNDEKEKMIFIFYNKKMESFYDLILFRAKCNKNIHIYFVNEIWQKNFIDKFKVKKLLGFVLIKNDINKEIFNEIRKMLESYDLNNDVNKIESKNNIQESTIEFK